MSPSNGEILNFLGAVLGAAITVIGSIWVINYQAWKRAKRDKANLLSFLAMLEERLSFVKSDEALDEFIIRRDVPGFINRCALVLEMTDLLNTNAVSEAAEGYRQLYILHKLRRSLTVWGSIYKSYADIPYTDFHTLASPDDFQAAVISLVVPTTIIRGSVHLYIAEITGRNIFLEEIKQFSGGTIPNWNPDNPITPN